MRTRCFFPLVVVFSTLAFAKDKKPDPSAFVHALNDARIRGGGAFTLNAHFIMNNVKGQPEGTYTLQWHNAANWKDVIDAPGYHEERGAENGHPWRKRSELYTPKPIFDAHSAVELDRFGWGGNQQSKVTEIHKRKVNNTAAWCADVSLGIATPAEVCISSDSGYAISAAAWELSDWKRVDKKTYPAKLVLLWKNSPELTFVVDDLISSAPEESEKYAPPEGSAPFPYCAADEFVPPRIDFKAQPEYPASARNSHVEGSVVSDVLLDETGIVKRATVVWGVNPALNEASTNAITRWRYKPALCGGKPMPVEVQIRVNYQLAGW